MTTSSGAASFLAGQQRQQLSTPKGKRGAASPSRQPGDEELLTPSGAPVSDLAPSANTFIRKLYQMVTTENQDIIAFTPDGLSFHVKDPARLEKEVLPKYFRHSRFQSLVRQLNFYDFKKTSKERIIWIYRHPLFQARKPHLLDDLKRKPSASLVKQQLQIGGSGSSTTTTTTVSSSGGNKAAARKSSKGPRWSGRPHSPFDPASQSDSGGNTTEADYYTFEDEDDEEAECGIEDGSTDGSEGGRFSGSPSGASTGMKRQRKSAHGGPGSSRKRRALAGRASTGSLSGRSYYYSDEEDGAWDDDEVEGGYAGPGASFNHHAQPQQQQQQQQPVNEEMEDEACWVMRKMKSSPVQRAPRLSLECHEEGFQQDEAEGQDGPLIAGEPYSTAGGDAKGADGVQQETACLTVAMEDKRLHSTPAGCAAAPTGAGMVVGEGTSSSPTATAPKPTTPAPYEPTAEEAKAWARVQALWAAAGEAEQMDLYAQLPSSGHAAFAGFFLAMAPFNSTAELIKACHDLLVACPALAEAVQQHRLALDPLSPARPCHPSDKTFNNRALREVLGFGLNHLAEAAAALPREDGRPAMVALRDCLSEWRAHMGRLL